MTFFNINNGLWVNCDSLTAENLKKENKAVLEVKGNFYIPSTEYFEIQGIFDINQLVFDRYTKNVQMLIDKLTTELLEKLSKLGFNDIVYANSIDNPSMTVITFANVDVHEL